MDWTETIARVIEYRTFDNIWYWFAVIVSWAVACHWMIGVPFDLLFRARKCPPQEIADLEAIVAINVRRFTFMADVLGPSLLGLAAFVFSGLAMAGFYYQFELAQGLFVLLAPLAIIVAMNLRLAYQLRANPLTGRALVQRLFAVRVISQVIGMVAIFLTAMYGMYYNLDRLFTL